MEHENKAAMRLPARMGVLYCNLLLALAAANDLRHLAPTANLAWVSRLRLRLRRVVVRRALPLEGRKWV